MYGGYEKSTVRLASVELAQARPNYLDQLAMAAGHAELLALAHKK